MKQLTLKNYFLIEGSEQGTNGDIVTVKSLNTWLTAKPFHSKELRLRNRFVRATKERGQEMEDTRRDLLDQFSKKDKDGKPVMVPGPKGEQYVLENQAEYSKQWNKYLDEEYVMDLNEELLESAIFVKGKITESIEKDNYSGRQSLLIEEWLEAFEGIKEKEG
jgi:hypothetical protein